MISTLTDLAVIILSLNYLMKDSSLFLIDWLVNQWCIVKLNRGIEPLTTLPELQWCCDIFKEGASLRVTLKQRVRWLDVLAGGDNGVVICRMDTTNEQYDASKNGDLGCMALATEEMGNVEIHDGFCLKNGCNDVFCCPPKRIRPDNEEYVEDLILKTPVTWFNYTSTAALIKSSWDQIKSKGVFACVALDMYNFIFLCHCHRACSDWDFPVS
ncbi:hypothetical protein V6N13_067217 [Hibiscus sabdariffa]